MSQVAFPLTGAGDATAIAATDEIGGAHYQRLKIFDGTEGSTIPFVARETTPGSTDPGMVVRPIGSTAFAQAVTLTNPTTAVNVANPTTAVTVTNISTAVTVTNPTTAVNVANPTTAVNVANQPTVDLSSVGSTRSVGTVNVSSGVVLGGSTAFIGLITSGVQNIGTVGLSSDGSTRVVGTVTVLNPTTAVNVANQPTVDLSSVGSTRFVGMNNYESFTVASRTSVASSADISLFPVATAHRVRLVQNQSTAAELLLNLSTQVVSSASTGSDIRIPVNGFVVFGGQTGNFPLFVGAIRCKIASTALNAVAIGIALSS